MTIIQNYLTTAMYQICFSILELHVYKSSAWEIKAYEISAFTRIEPYYRTEGAVDPYRDQGVPSYRPSSYRIRESGPRLRFKCA